LIDIIIKLPDCVFYLLKNAILLAFLWKSVSRSLQGIYKIPTFKMVSFYGTVYKPILYNLIIPFPACESGAEREKRRAIVFTSGKTGKSE